jgi:cytochrome c oxidase subunit II
MNTRSSRLRRLGYTGLVLAVGLVLSSCEKNNQNTLHPKGSVARTLNDLFTPVFWIAVVIFVLVEGAVLFFALKFKAKSDDDAPRQIHGNSKLEITWTILPALLLAGIAIPTVKTVFDIYKKPVTAVTVDVTGHRWWWEYSYEGHNIHTANELYIPAGQKVEINLTSADVMHNFWPPQLAGKVYAIPGRSNHMVIEADQPGTYHGQCAEYCGTSHANMRLEVVALSQSDFDNWVTEQEALPSTPTAGSDAAAGMLLFQQKGCAGCHTVNGISAGAVGPNLTHLQSRQVFAGSIFQLNDENLRKWLRNPPAEKPGSVMPNLNLSEDEITKLIAYLDTLK